MVLNYDSKSINELSYDELAQETGQISEPFVNDSFPFNLSLTLKGFNADTLIRELINLLHKSGNCEHTQRLDAHLKVIIANLIKGENYHLTRYPFYSRHPNNYKYIKRYNPLRITFKPLISAINGLAEIRYIKNYTGYFDRETQRGKQSRIVAQHPLFQLMEKHSLSVADVLQLPSEPIRLKNEKKMLIDYEDTPLINKMRNDLIKHNCLLSKSSIQILPSKELKEYLSYNENDAVDFTQQSYHRIFSNSSFTLHGRYYGTWWQSIKRKFRPFITINEQKTVELDYNALHPHLLYSKLNINYEEEFGRGDDPYSLEGFDSSYRPIIKVATLTSLNMKTAKYFSQTIASRLRKEGIFQEHIPYKEIKNKMLAKHHKLKDYFFTGVGLELMFKDSCISEYIIRKMTNKKIPILSIHDSYVVAVPYKELLLSVMLKAFKSLKIKSIPPINCK
tara:strand:+ start:577 stop:1923 length:1347 start_codon:yes stop_codon:yes gene_type:complete